MADNLPFQTCSHGFRAHTSYVGEYDKKTRNNLHVASVDTLHCIATSTLTASSSTSISLKTSVVTTSNVSAMVSSTGHCWKVQTENGSSSSYAKDTKVERATVSDVNLLSSVVQYVNAK